MALRKTKQLFIVTLVAACFFSFGYFCRSHPPTTAVKQDNNAVIKQGGYPVFTRVFSVEGSFEDVKDDLLEAIEGRGLVVSYTSHAKTMLDNTADVAGVTNPVYTHAEILSFCKADLSHALVSANPHNIVLCPYNISIYVLPNQVDQVYLSFRKGEESEAKTQPIDDLLVSIIEEVAL